MINKHEGDVRQFRWLSQAWYGEANLGRQRRLVDEIMIGMYSPEGGTSGEFAIRWTDLGGKPVPMLCAFDDSWSALQHFGDVLAKLAEVDG